MRRPSWYAPLLATVGLSCAVVPVQPNPTPPALPQPVDKLGALRIDHDLGGSSRLESADPISVELMLEKYQVLVKKISVLPGQQYSLRLPFEEYQFKIQSHGTKSFASGIFVLDSEHPTKVIKVSALRPARELYLMEEEEDGDRQLFHRLSSLTLLTSKHQATVRIIPDPLQAYRDPEPSREEDSVERPPIFAVQNEAIFRFANPELSAFMDVMGTKISASQPSDKIGSKDDATRIDEHALRSLSEDYSNNPSRSLTPVELKPEGVVVSIPTTLFVPAGSWSVLWEGKSQEFNLKSGSWTVIDFDEEPTKVRVFLHGPR